MAVDDLVRDLGTVGMADVATVGGKAAGLGELIRAGIPVPPGRVVTTAAFHAALADLDPTGLVAREVGGVAPGDAESLGRAGRALRARVEAAPVPEEVGEAIRGGYRALGGVAGTAPGEVPVAVRSSATSEDSAEASFAGVQDTYLWVRGEDQVLDQVRRCWGSLYDVESLTYRLQRGLGETGLAMGVVIQQMVDAQASGVVFTRSPVTGDRSVIALEASWGLGSAVVSGEVTPDRYTVNKVTGEVITNDVSTKTRRHRPDPAGNGVRAEAVPAALQDRPCLDEAELARLVEVARRVEAHYGAPQDIEWAIAADPAGASRVLVLQSRPETVWSGRPERPLAKPRGRPFDHVVSLLGGQVDPPGDARP